MMRTAAVKSHKPFSYLFFVSASEVCSSAGAPPGVQAEAQQQRPGDLLLTEKQTPAAEQPAAAEGTGLC